VNLIAKEDLKRRKMEEKELVEDYANNVIWVGL
jgi:hypothetical protein